MEVSGRKRNYCKSCGQLVASIYSEGFCSQCEEEICQRRFDTHKQFKLNRGHIIVQSVEAKSKSKETPTFGCCIEHLDKGIICFCLEHDQVCCVECMLVSHFSCKREYIFEHIECYEDSEEFSQLKRDIEKNDIEAKAMLGSIRRNKDYVKDVNKKFALDVKLYREEVISHITELADAMLKHGDDIMAADLEKIKILEKQSEMLVDETNDMRDTLQSEADQPYTFFLTCLSYKRIIHLVHDQLERIKQSNTIETYDFTLDCNLRQLMKTCKQLGTLKRSGNKFDYKLQEKMVNVSARQSRLLEMDNYSAGLSDKQTIMKDRSKFAFYENRAKSTEPPQQKTEIQRREYHPAQSAPAIKRDNVFPLQNFSPRKMKSLDMNRWSPHYLEIFQHPMCLISAVNEKNETGKETKILLKSEEKVFDQIAEIEWPLVVVAVAGLYRTGKSYLMNRLANSNKGFALGDTIESKTKGIWAWCQIHPTRFNTVLLLLDTEGLGDVEKGDPRYDNKIFTLATLLCNCLVYNMKGAFDNDAVSKLTFVTEMASNIRFRGKSSEDNQSINLILPDFVLCLRDFSLKLIKDGKKITENDYLEQSLAENLSKADQFNKPRACIRKYFKRRECFAFPVPGDGDVLENLETLSFTQLSTRFKEVTARFASYIYLIPPKNLLGSKPINGQMFVTLADRYVTAIKNGAVPDVDDAFTAVAKIENAKVETEALDIFKNEMETVILPVSESALGNRYTNAQNKALHHLRQNVVHDFQAECQIEAQRKMDAIWNKVKATNEKKVREKCENTVQKVFMKYLKTNLKNREYETAGGHRRYKRAVKRTKDEYISALRDFKENEILSTWYGFVESMTKTEARIIEADEDMSQMEKEDEQRRNQEELDELLRQQQKAHQDALLKEKKYLADHYEKIDVAVKSKRQIKKDMTQCFKKWLKKKKHV